MPISSYGRLLRGEHGHSHLEFFEGAPTAARILVFAVAVGSYFAVLGLLTWLLPDVMTQGILGEVIPRILAVAAAALVLMSSERLLAREAQTTERPAEEAG